jgi:hypothetical protein
MKVPAVSSDPSTLAAVAKRCVQLLCASEFDTLAQSFGYAVALGREPSSAIAADLTTSLREVGANALVGDGDPQITVKSFAPGQSLLAAVECAVLTSNDRRVLVELVATESNGHMQVSLEQISAAA